MKDTKKQFNKACKDLEDSVKRNFKHKSESKEEYLLRRKEQAN